MKDENIRKEWEEFVSKYSILFMSNEEQWYDTLEKIKLYIETNNKLPSSTDKNKDIKQLGIWVSTQKNNYKNQEYIMKDENIRKEWEEFVSKYSILFMSNEEQWYDTLEKIKLYIETNNKLPSKRDKNKDIKQLGMWVSNQKTTYKNQEQIMKDENIRKEWEEFVSKYSHIFSK
jgi:predicted phosphohydrolase